MIDYTPQCLFFQHGKLNSILKLNVLIKIILMFTVIFLQGTLYAAVHEYETTHLKAMAGSGAASIVAEKSAFYNPAPLSLVNTSSLYFQKDNGTLGKSTGFVVTNGQPGLSGSISFVNQVENDYRRSRWGVS